MAFFEDVKKNIRVGMFLAAWSVGLLQVSMILRMGLLKKYLSHIALKVVLGMAYVYFEGMIIRQVRVL